MITKLRHTGIALSLIAVLGGPLYGCASSPDHKSTGQYIDDAAITTKVKAKLLGDSITEGLKVDVDTYKGAVTLSGYVNNARQRERAAEMAQTVAGVTSVRNNLLVK